MEPNSLITRWLDRPTEILRTGVGELYPAAQAAARIPAGHPEGYLEAFRQYLQELCALPTGRV